MNYKEADYPRARILIAVPDSLLARVADLGVATTVEAPREHPLRGTA